MKRMPTLVIASVNPKELQNSLGGEMAKAFGTAQPEAVGIADRSLANALAVLKDMKAAGHTWQEMGERMEREFGSKLEKEQLKALVR